MGRQQRPLDPASGPVAAFASDLREVHRRAESPKFTTMARQVQRSRTALTEAVGGDHMPTWETTAAFVAACGGDPQQWRQRWQSAHDEARKHRDASVQALGGGDASASKDDDAGASQALSAAGDEESPTHVGAVAQRTGSFEASPTDAAPVGHGGDSASEPAPQGEATHRQPDLQTGVGGRARVAKWAIAVVLPSVAGLIMVTLLRSPSEVTGTVACSDRQQVVGVWVKAERRADSGFASWTPESEDHRAAFEFDLQGNARWTVNVGCGGTLEKWRSSIHGVEWTTSRRQNWVCSSRRTPTELPAGCRPAG